MCRFFFFFGGGDCIYSGGSFLQLGITKNKFIDMFKLIFKKVCFTVNAMIIEGGLCDRTVRTFQRPSLVNLIRICIYASL